ncbi:YwdI family protein [Paenibacillus sp. BSR1-1]|uniref:YwdI family protein n=1 Tax=Paenibacillus sp. BSR1-1 TaxID=3020845 RepID=UPI0025AFFA08|nr:YwdI family protein [Paenibacillus sp. BSR1-1]MDN3017722.1 YwdI family protein [Paenibacillus sp. BSR1-1]
MNISIQKLLDKMETELKQAQTAQKEESLREKIYSIKILCELILEEKPGIKEASWNQASKVQVQPVIAQPVFQNQPVSLQQPKKLELGDEANGDSLFDF